MAETQRAGSSLRLSSPSRKRLAAGDPCDQAPAPVAAPTAAASADLRALGVPDLSDGDQPGTAITEPLIFPATPAEQVTRGMSPRLQAAVDTAIQLGPIASWATLGLILTSASKFSMSATTGALGALVPAEVLKHLQSTTLGPASG